MRRRGTPQAKQQPRSTFRTSIRARRTKVAACGRSCPPRSFSVPSPRWLKPDATACCELVDRGSLRARGWLGRRPPVSKARRQAVPTGISGDVDWGAGAEAADHPGECCWGHPDAPVRLGFAQGAADRIGAVDGDLAGATVEFLVDGGACAQRVGVWRAR